MSLSWCNQDPDLLLSSGKDNRTLCWNPQTGQALGEFPVVTNWTFQTRWNPHNPNFFATASFDGRVSVQTIQNTRTDTAQPAADQNQALDGEDFFAKAQTQPQASHFTLPKAPKWLERPCGASFGFGGRVVSFNLDKEKRTSKIKISPFEVDETVGNATETFENALKDGDLKSICESRAAGAVSEEEKADWKVIETLISDSPRKRLVEYLGFDDQTGEAADKLADMGLNEKPANGDAEKKTEKAGGKKHKRLQSMFDASPEEDSFLSDLSSSKGARTNNPFQIFGGSESEAEKSITRALLLGDFQSALDVALKENRMSDAFMIAICGGQKCVEKAQERYFSKQAEGPNYIRLLASIAGKNLWDVVYNADLANWKAIMAALCTFADDKEFAGLCDALGERLEEQTRDTEDKSTRKDASFCFLAGSKLEKVVAIWIEELRENEQKGIEAAADNSAFSIHVRALQGLIEKVTIFRQVTNFQDVERTKEADWKLENLYDKYIEYADVVATHGRLQIAQRYLDLVPDKHPEAEVQRNRIKLAMWQTAPKTLPTGPTSRAPSRPQATAYPPQSTFAGGAPAPSPVQNPYAPPVAAPQQMNPYAPPAAAQAPPPADNPYASLAGGAYQPPQAPAYGAQQPRGPVPPPPRASTQSPSNVTSYANATNLPGWNDLPDNFGKPVSRRGTPAAAAPISAPFPNQSPPMTQGPPPVGPPQGAQRAAVPPPPKGTAPPPRMTSPPSTGSPQASAIQPGPSPPPNPYASLPQAPPSASMGVPPPVARGPSPYNAPPTVPPPPNRYAPNPAAQPASPQVQSRGPVPPPPQAGAVPPPPSGPSMYAAQPPSAASPYAPATPPTAQPPMQQPPPQGSRPSTASSQRNPTPAPPKYRKPLPQIWIQPN